MTATRRFLLRVRRRAVQGYELLLYALLLALAFGAALAFSATGAESAHCGQSQSSTVVITR